MFTRIFCVLVLCVSFFVSAEALAEEQGRQQANLHISVEVIRSCSFSTGSNQLVCGDEETTSTTTIEEQDGTVTVSF